MTAINLRRLAADIEEHTGVRPTLHTVTSAATDLAVMGTHHLLDMHGGRVILAREHYATAPDDARELTEPKPRRRVAPDVPLAFIVCGWFAAMTIVLAWHGAWGWALVMALFTAGVAAAGIGLMRLDGAR